MTPLPSDSLLIASQGVTLFDRHGQGMDVGGIDNNTALVVAASGLGRDVYLATGDFESLAEHIGLRPFLSGGLWVVSVEFANEAGALRITARGRLEVEEVDGSDEWSWA